MDVTIEQLLGKARELSASDIHIAAGAACHCRIHGQLRAVGEEALCPEDTKALALSVMPESRKKILEKRGEASFACSFAGLGRCRLHIFRQQGLYGIVAHLIPMQMPDWKRLGMPESVMALAKKKKGLVLVTGPSGMGKSTTLTALIGQISQTSSRNIVTLENPVEYIHQHGQSLISQREIGVDVVSAASGLEAALEGDVDVVMAGELKDPDMICRALEVAENGRLVLASLYTIGAVASIERLVGLFPEEQQRQKRVQISNVLEAVVSQQLIPTIDGNGRALACEVMHMTPAIKNLIRESKSHQMNGAIQAARKQGMQTMDDAIYDLYSAGRITDERALEFALDPVALERKLY